jgi:hypothetical protein
VSDRINIKWRPGLAAGAKNRVRQDRGLRRVPGYELIEAELGWEVCELPPGLALKEIGWLMNHPNVEAVEPEGFGVLIKPVEIRGTGDRGQGTGLAEGSPASVEAGTEWWQRFVKAPEAWAVTKGLGAVGAITDNGLGPHPFTDPRLVETKIFDLAETDPWGGSHGNPVTGCAVGIAPACGVTNYKIAGGDVRCSWNDVSNAWLHAKAMGRKVVNTSWGGGSSLLLVDTASKLRTAAVAVVCAAGNSGDATQFPGNNRNVYAVSALDEAGNIAGFSCRGKIDIAAPGVGLLTTTSGGGWAHFSGTSGAAPIIAGCLLLILARNPTWTGVQAMEHLMATATPKLPATDYGAGLPNAAKAVGAEETAPPPVEPPPPPPPEPPPVGTDIVDITGLASITCDFPAFEAAGEGLGNLTDGSNKQALWFRYFVNLEFNMPEAYEWHGFRVKSANDHPPRDPEFFEAQADGVQIDSRLLRVFEGRFSEQSVTFAEPRAGKKLMLYLESSGESTPGDKGQGILQLSELRILGRKAPAGPPPPPPTETWTPKTEETVERSDYTPTVVEQSRVVTTTIRSWEESNLGNKRNEVVATVNTTETRSVQLPTT